MYWPEQIHVGNSPGMSKICKASSITFSPIFIGILFLGCFHDSENAYSESPIFKFQEIKDPYGDLKNLDDNKNTDQESPFQDILSVNYRSDGKILNSTMWLSGEVIGIPLDYTVFNFGMYIDADFNRQTGYGGIDYKLEVAWDKDSKSWTKTLEKWSLNGDPKTITKEKNYTGLFENGKKYVELPLDLKLLDYPLKYKITYFTDTKEGNNDPLISDFTKWIVVPPLELTITTLPTVIELFKGEEKRIEMRVNSSQGYEPKVELSTLSQTGSIENVEFQNKTLNIPTYGIATTPMTIEASSNSKSGSYTLILFANSTFPAEQLIDDLGANITSDIELAPDLSENVFAKSSVLVTIIDPPTWDENIKKFWDNIGGATLFLYGIVAGLIPWLYTSIKNRKKKR
jgi:hypothetical protein